ncbi:VWA domain-containing protein [Bifidobacterium platyrrhinorum]|uniref:VWA domain-containing protein n=1 Tax=Bifidobacterium platyrrhinorum TaxID=2661628 RepID=A0A6L9SP69_9BIFI|nr:VWA domain-containing protein [Bifidobacterium platyrrhinorum]NEG54317.1 VWA domain-containing protein [Bifidobacterium platyrrhinorum]
MGSWTLSPTFGWPVGGPLAAVMLLFAVVGVIRHARGAAGDETVGSCVRRTLSCLLAAAIVLTPSMVSSTTSRAVNATDVVVAVDVTGSMAVDDATYGSDAKITRLEAARKAVDDLTSMYADSSFAALRFGASGTLDVPLTPDAPAIRSWANTLVPEATSVSAGSTLDAPLDQLVTTLKQIREDHPDDAVVLYVITDGEQTSSKARRTFSTLRSYLDDAYAIGVGSTEGGNIPKISDGVSDSSADTQEWVTDPDTGQPGVSKMDEGNLKDIADEMGGSYLALSSGATMDRALSSKVSDAWKMTDTAKRRTRLTPVVWPLAIALTALLAWEAGAQFALSRRLL